MASKACELVRKFVLIQDIILYLKSRSQLLLILEKNILLAIIIKFRPINVFQFRPVGQILNRPLIIHVAFPSNFGHASPAGIKLHLDLPFP